MRRHLPQAGPIVASDISVHALRSIPEWERVYARRIAGGVACRSYSLPFRDASLALVFAFQAAHHFVAHRRTLAEIHRVLSPGGLCLYLHEPTCPEWIHPLAHKRVNAKRPEVPEDVLVHSRILSLGRAAGFETWSVDDCTLAKRGPLEFLYYLALGRIPILRKLLPCTRDLVFRKPE